MTPTSANLFLALWKLEVKNLAVFKEGYDQQQILKVDTGQIKKIIP